jgi:hypothetical protein
VENEISKKYILLNRKINVKIIGEKRKDCNGRLSAVT